MDDTITGCLCDFFMTFEYSFCKPLIGANGKQDAVEDCGGLDTDCAEYARVLGL
jgi:hypothetical protein